jgi:hypothetical protein
MLFHVGDAPPKRFNLFVEPSETVGQNFVLIAAR